MNRPLISVVTPSFNQGEFIRDTIESVLAQGYKHFEHIIVDGGSTDGTLQILKSYPHLQWTSEPDRGQSHALNKGLQKARGEIIAWINSDDWYAPNCFMNVVKALAQSEWVMGRCMLTDRFKNPILEIPNYARTWNDLIRYWCPYAIPTQPAMFFKKRLLDRARLPNGDYVDESRYYCMDYDLWLRMLEHDARLERIDQLLACYRTWEANKTGSSGGDDIKRAWPEMSAISRRSITRVAPSSITISYVLPCQTPDTLRTCVMPLLSQDLKGVEVVVLPAASSSSMEFTNEARHVADITGAAIRVLAPHADPLSALISASEHGGAILVYGLPKAPLPELSSELLHCFEDDRIGLLVPKSTALASVIHGTGLDLGALFNASFSLEPFAIRKIALADLPKITKGECAQLFASALLIALDFKGWKVQAIDMLSDAAQKTTPAQEEEEEEEVEVFRQFINAELVTLIESFKKNDTFAQSRLEGRTEYCLPNEVVTRFQKIRALAPPQWFALSLTTQRIVQEITTSHPNFSPAWYSLAQQCVTQGDVHGARAAFDAFKNAHATIASLWQGNPTATLDQKH